MNYCPIARAQKDNEENGHNEAWGAVADQYDETAGRVEVAFVSNGLCDSQYDAYAISQEKASDSQRRGDGQFFFD